MKLTVSPIAGVAYLAVRPFRPFGFGIAFSEEVSPGVFADYTSDGEVSGYEMLDAAKFLSPSLYERPHEASEAELVALREALEASRHEP